MADTCQNHSIQLRLSVIFPLILIRLSWVFEADTPFKLKQHANRSTLRTKIWLKTIDQLLVNNFLTRSLSHTNGMLLSFFFKFYANLTSNKGNIRESLP